MAESMLCLEKRPARDRLLTPAMTSRFFSLSRSTNWRPMLPVAPVTKILPMIGLLTDTESLKREIGVYE